MRIFPRPPLFLFAVTLALMVSVFGMPPSMAQAAGHDFTGRQAPELSFSEGINGVDATTTLSSLRGQVVWVKFWLRDCPVCQAQMPEAQRLHERWGKSGLVVLTVMNRWSPREIQPLMRRRGWNFPVAIDPRGAMGHRYGVKRRPTDYLVDVDGRIVASNRVTEQQVALEMSRYRVRELNRRIVMAKGAAPSNWPAVRAHVQAGNYGPALRAAESMKEVLAKSPAPAVTTALTELQTIAKEKIDIAVARAKSWASRGRRAQAVTSFRAIYTSFRGSSLEAHTKKIYDDYMLTIQGGPRKRAKAVR